MLSCAVDGVLVRAITSRSWWRPATPSLGKDRYRCELTVRGDRNSRSPISRSVRPSLASRTIWRCWGVSSHRASGSAGAPAHPARSELRLGPLRPGPGTEPPEGLQGLGQDGLGVVDPAPPPQPFAVVEAELGPLEGPLVPGGIGERRAETGLGPVRTGEEAAGPGDELLEPGRGRSVEAAQCVLEDVGSFQPPVGADRGGGEIGHAQVGGVVVQRRAVLAEQPAELGERLEVAAVGQSRDAEGPPGPGGHQPAVGRIDGRQRPAGMPAGRGGVAAQGQDGGGDHVSGRGDDIHLVRLGQAGGLGGNVQGLVPAPGVDVGPPQHGQAPAAGASHAGSPEPLHGVLQQADRQVGFVQEPGGGTYPPQRGLFKGRADDPCAGTGGGGFCCRPGRRWRESRVSAR